jgi:hypothetical protein
MDDVIGRTVQLSTRIGISTNLAMSVNGYTYDPALVRETYEVFWGCLNPLAVASFSMVGWSDLTCCCCP